jgi:hypothetical protein
MQQGSSQHFAAARAVRENALANSGYRCLVVQASRLTREFIA